MCSLSFIITSVISKWLDKSDSFDSRLCITSVIVGCRPWVILAAEEVMELTELLHQGHDYDGLWVSDLVALLNQLDEAEMDGFPFILDFIRIIADRFVIGVSTEMDKEELSPYFFESLIAPAA